MHLLPKYKFTLFILHMYLTTIIKIIDNFSSIHHLYFSALHVSKLSGKNVCRQLYPKENYSYKMFIQSSYNCFVEQLRSYSFITTSIHLDNCVLQTTCHNLLLTCKTGENLLLVRCTSIPLLVLG